MSIYCEKQQFMAAKEQEIEQKRSSSLVSRAAVFLTTQNCFRRNKIIDESVMCDEKFNDRCIKKSPSIHDSQEVSFFGSSSIYLSYEFGLSGIKTLSYSTHCTLLTVGFSLHSYLNHGSTLSTAAMEKRIIICDFPLSFYNYESGIIFQRSKECSAGAINIKLTESLMALKQIIFFLSQLSLIFDLLVSEFRMFSLFFVSQPRNEFIFPLKIPTFTR